MVYSEEEWCIILLSYLDGSVSSKRFVTTSFLWYMAAFISGFIRIEIRIFLNLLVD